MEVGGGDVQDNKREQKRAAGIQPNKKFLGKEISSNIKYNKLIDEQKRDDKERKRRKKKEERDACYGSSDSDESADDSIKKMFEFATGRAKKEMKKKTKKTKTMKKDDKKSKQKKEKQDSAEEAIEKFLNEIKIERRKRRVEAAKKRRSKYVSSSESDEEESELSDTSEEDDKSEEEKREREKHKRKHSHEKEKRKYKSKSGERGDGYELVCSPKKPLKKKIKQDINLIDDDDDSSSFYSSNNDISSSFSTSSSNLEMKEPTLTDDSMPESDKVKQNDENDDTFEEEITIRRIPKMYDKAYFTQKIIDGDEKFLKMFEEIVIRRKVPQAYTRDDLKKLFDYESNNKLNNNK